MDRWPQCAAKVAEGAKETPLLQAGVHRQSVRKEEQIRMTRSTSGSERHWSRLAPQSPGSQHAPFAHTARWDPSPETLLLEVVWRMTNGLGEEPQQLFFLLGSSQI
jgi:hypothetical protein